MSHTRTQCPSFIYVVTVNIMSQLNKLTFNHVRNSKMCFLSKSLQY